MILSVERRKPTGAGSGSASGASSGAGSAGRFFNKTGDDLAIGARTGSRTMRMVPVGGSGASTLVSGGPAVYLLPDVDPNRAIEITSGQDDTSNQFGAALAVMTNFDKGHDTLVIGAPGSESSHGQVFLYRRAYYDTTGTAIAPELLASFSGSTSGGGFGRSLAAFRTREENATGHSHWLAVGAPSANVGGEESGSVALYSVPYSGEINEEHRMHPQIRQKARGTARTTTPATGRT